MTQHSETRLGASILLVFVTQWLFPARSVAWDIQNATRLGQVLFSTV